jgi:hypothetical protein
MNKLTRSFKAGLKGYKAGVNALAEAMRPARYQGGGHPIRCLQCGGEVFQERDTGILGLGTVLTCDRCGLSQLYGKKPERREA